MQAEQSASSLLHIPKKKPQEAPPWPAPVGTPGWISFLQAKSFKKRKNIGELGEKQALGSSGMEPGGKMGVLGMRSWEGVVQETE